MDFPTRVRQAIQNKRSCILVGLDPHLALLPTAFAQRASRGLHAAAVEVEHYLREVIDATYMFAAGVKLQSAFFEMLGPVGVEALCSVAEYAKDKGLLVIGDFKRGDIGSTADAYAAGYLGEIQIGDVRLQPRFRFDAMTVNPYLGDEGLLPFAAACAAYETGIFVLVRTSNPSSDALQARKLSGDPQRQVFEVVGDILHDLIVRTFPDGGYQPIGAVAGATYPADLKAIRAQLPRSILLVPGYGAQGATAADLLPAFDRDGFGALVNASRSITFAYRTGPSSSDPFRAAADAAERMLREINSALGR